MRPQRLGNRAKRANSLPSHPRPPVEPGPVLFVRHPMRRQVGGVGLQLEAREWMSGGEQIVVDGVSTAAEMTVETAGSRDRRRPQIDHAARHRVSVGPARFGVTSDPAFGRAVASFAGDPVAPLLGGGLLRRGVTGKASRRRRRRPGETEHRHHPRRGFRGQHRPRLSVRILGPPDAVLVLARDCVVGARRWAAMATRGRARPRTDVPAARLGPRHAEKHPRQRHPPPHEAGYRSARRRGQGISVRILEHLAGLCVTGARADVGDTATADSE